jgi:hypothetical protein
VAAVNTTAISAGDVVLVHVKRGDRRFLAVVASKDGQTLHFEPINYNCPYYFAQSREVLAHWAKRPNPAGPRRSATIHADDIVRFLDGADSGWARVLERRPRRLRVRPLLGSEPERELSPAAILVHYARRGRRRPTR